MGISLSVRYITGNISQTGSLSLLTGSVRTKLQQLRMVFSDWRSMWSFSIYPLSLPRFLNGLASTTQRTTRLATLPIVNQFYQPAVNERADDDKTLVFGAGYHRAALYYSPKHVHCGPVNWARRRRGAVYIEVCEGILKIITSLRLKNRTNFCLWLQQLTRSCSL